MVPFLLPKLLLNAFFSNPIRSPLHDGKRLLTGKKVAASSTDILFQDIKTCSKQLQVTINDLITSCLSATLKQYFEIKGDITTNRTHIVIPANIRFQNYQKRSEIKLQNKFAPIQVTIPLSSNLGDALVKIPRTTSKLRNKF